jgi:hypothetical protein
MAGFGRRFGSGPYGGPLPVPASENPRPLVSSRSLIAGARGDVYELDGEGGDVGMDDVAQRVRLLLAFEAGPRAPNTTPRELAARAGRLRAALAPLSSGPAPAIVIEDVKVERTSAGHVRESVTFRRTDTNTRQTVEGR